MTTTCDRCGQVIVHLDATPTTDTGLWLCSEECLRGYLDEQPPTYDVREA